MTTIPPGVRALIDVFEAHLSDVKFPDVDLATLAAASSEVETARERVRAAEATLAEARQELATNEEALLAMAVRAHAYARVYSEATPEVAARLAAITLPGRARRPRAVPVDGAPRRGRPRKVPLQAVADAAE